MIRQAIRGSDGRRRWRGAILWAVIVGALTIAPGVAQASARAAAALSGDYDGTTSQGYEIVLVVGNGQARVHLSAIEVTCDDGSTELDGPLGFGLMQVQGGHFSASIGSGDVQGNISGDVNPQDASGTAEYTTFGPDLFNMKNLCHGTVTWNATNQTPQLQARITQPEAVARGEAVTLDASPSTPASTIVSYEFHFSPGPGCPNHAHLATTNKPGDGQGTMPTTSVKLLCPLDVTVTVKDNNGQQDTTLKPVLAEVRARTGEAWKTQVKTTRLLRMDKAFDPEPPHFAVKRGPHGMPEEVLRLLGGVNTPDCAGSKNADSEEVICPNARRGSWNDRGYALTTLQDPGGPFDGWFYVDSASFEILAKAQFNHWIWADSKPLPGSDQSGPNFYHFNVSHHTPVKEFLRALKAHEGDGVKGVEHSGHTSAFRDYIEASRAERDPRRIAEAGVGPSADAVTKRLDAQLVVDQRAICKASEDPLADTFKQDLWVWSTQERQWVLQLFDMTQQKETRPCGD